MINKKIFTNADLNGAHQLVYTHNLNTQDLIPTLYDSAGIQTVTVDNFSLGDPDGNNKDNTVTLSMGGAISDTRKLLLSYQSTAESSSGRAAFELATDAEPVDAMRIIVGKAATPSVNMTFTQLFAHLMSKLGFLKLAENLNDLPDKAISRASLGVYSTAAVDNIASGKATLYQAASGAVLGVSNGAVYEPITDYNPATKRYVDVNAPRLLHQGSFAVPSLTNGESDLIVEMGVTLDDTDYMVCYEWQVTGGSYPFRITGSAVKTKLTTSFVLRVLNFEDGGHLTYNLNYKIFAL